MTIQAQLADGRILEFPDGTDPSVVQATVKRIIGSGATQDVASMSTEQLENAPTAPTSISDVARSFGIGAVGGVKSLADVFGAGSDTSEYLGEKMKELQAGITPARKAEIARRQELEKRAAESGDTFKEIKTFLGGIAEAPLQSAAQGVGSSAPTILASLAAIPAGAPAGLAVGVGVISKYALGAAQGVGEFKGNVLDEVERAYLEKGYDKDKAKELALKAQEYSADKAFEIGGSALLGALDAFTGIESSVSKAARSAAAKKIAGEITKSTVEGLPEKALLRPSLAGSAVRSAAGEAPLEGVQGGFGEYAKNLALIKEGLLDPNLAMQGVFGAAARDAAVGALAGTVFTPVEQANRLREYQLDQGLRQQQEQEQLLKEQEKAALRPPEPESYEFLGGYKATAEKVGETEEPEGYQIFAEGSDTPLTTVGTPDEVQPKIERLNEIRTQETRKALEQIDKINEGVAKARTAVETMEATGQTQDESYMQAKETLRVQEEQAQEQVTQLMERTQALSAPLTMRPMAPVVKVQNEYVLTKDNQPVGRFKTPGQAESYVAEQIGPEEYQKRYAEKQAATEVHAALSPMLKQFGLKDVGLEVVQELPNKAGGSYLNRLIKVAMDEPNPIQTMRHESVHALKDLGFFTPDQWRVLSDRASKEWINKYLGGVKTNIDGVEMTRLEGYRKLAEKRGLTPEQAEQEIVEEAIADAFGDYDRGAKPPPGLIAALFKRIKAFFDALRNSLKGAGFQTADDIFKQIEEGKLKPAKAEEAKVEKASLKRPAEEGEVEISTQNPSGVTRAYNPITQMLSIDEKAVMEVMETNKEFRDRTIAALKSYGFLPEGIKDKDVIPLFKESIVNNLLYLYNLVPEDIRQRSKLWYDGANKISEQMAEKYGLSLRQVSAIMAAMSPQKDWFQNVSMGERAIDILTQQGDRSWSPEMLQYAESYVNESKDRAEREKRQEDFEKIKKVASLGTTLNEMDIKSAAAFIRAFDEAFHSRQYRIVTPEGAFGDIVRNNDGTPSTMMWSTYGPIEKTVSIFRDGSRENVSEQLGFEHKIRSFYNNIAAPQSDLEHVTIDTHAVAAALFEALAGTDPEVIQNFGGTGKSNVFGVGGTYGLIADAYRDAAKQVGILPREMQSITWEAVRGLFNEDIKKAIKNPIKAEWAKYKSGEQSFEQARKNIIEISRNKRTNDKGVDIPPPDWVGSGEGEFVSDGGASYDKDYVPAGGVRLRESQEIRDKLTFNLSAVTNSIPGLRELYSRALKRDEGAIKVLQTVAESSLKHLLSGTNARIKIERANGVYLSDREPSLMVSAAFAESEGKAVLGALARFAKNFNQQQIHVRMGTKKKFGFDYDDGSYVTRVYTIPLKKELSDKAISGIIDKSGLKGFTVTKDELITYFVKPTKKEGENNEQYAKRVKEEFSQFTQSVSSAHVLAGKDGERMGKRDERLFVYGEGYGATLDYESISSNIFPKQSADTVTPRIVAEYLTGKPVQAFKQKPLSKALIKEQQRLAQVFETLPVNDLKNPLVKKAYKALTKALKEQFAVLPIKVELQTAKDEDGNIIAPYNNDSAAMRKDIVDRNHMLVYPTTPSTFGPEGYDFSNHPLLEDSGFKDINGKPMLFNDVLRAVHDYFAHGMAEAQFGPAGEFTAWRNHMASTPDPMARWALTAETRLQNAWQNFNPGAAAIPLKERPYALQKAALPPVEFLFTGDAAVDTPVTQMIETLPEENRQGSKPEKFSLRTSYPSAQAAVEATKDLKAPDTREFKLFQGGSQLKNEDGNPKLMFHGSKNIFFEFKENAPIFVADDAETAEYFSRAFKGQSKLQDQIYPLWVRAETPFDFANMGHVDALVQKVGDPAIHDKVKEGDWRTIEKPEVQKALKELGFDSFYVNEERTDTGKMTKNLAVFKATQVKSATGNFGDFSEKKDIRFSLPQVSAAANAAVGRVTTVREEKGWAERLLTSLAPESFSAFRSAAINRYNRLGEADRLRAEKMGGTALLARESAEAAALMSDNHAGVVASVMGVGNRRGGVPIIKNGMTMVDHSKKGVAAIFAPLAKYNDPKIYQYFQFYSAVKRGARLIQEGKERLIQPADIQHAKELGQKFPEFEDIRKDWVAFNDAVVDYQVKAGVLNKEQARLFTMYSDYIPFYRQMDGEQTIGPRIYQSISGVRPPKALKGGEAPLADFLETVVRNTHAAIGAGMKNIAAQRAVKVGKEVQIVHDIQPGSKVSDLDTISVLENGELVRYQANDRLFINAVKSLNMPDLPFIGILAAPANLLRGLVTRDPGFIMANLLRDSLSAYVTSGTNATPIAGTIINFGKAMKGVSPAYQALMDAGIIGGYEFSANIEQSGATFAKDLAKKSGKGAGVLSPFISVWEGLEKATTASDAATRMAIYERVMQETGDEAEALYRAQEVMNFNRKGSSAVVRILTAAVPFLNARIQGLDIFYRASTGEMNTKDAKEIQRKFWVRGMTMMGLSMMYYFAVAGNPDYEEQEQETKDNNWIIPGMFRIPIPFEVGTLFKTVPERIARYYFGNDTGEDFRAAMWRAANGFVPLSPAAYLPQTMKPILEAMTNYNFFTQREIVGMELKDIDPEFQVKPNTSALAQWIGKLGLSPLKVDHVIKGYTGTMGMYAVDTIDTVMDQFGDSPKPAKRFEQMPFIKRFAVDPEARGSVTAYYDLKHTVDTTVRTMNLLERTNKPEEYADYVRENAGVLAVKDFVGNLDKTMTELREMRGLINNSPLSATEKRDALTAIGQAEKNLTAKIQIVKKEISQLK